MFLKTFHQAELPAVLKYLHGCKYFAPRGRWVATSTGKNKCTRVSAVIIGVYIHIYIYVYEAIIFEQLDLKHALKGF